MERMFEVALQSAMNKVTALLAIMLLQIVLKQVAVALVIVGGNVADLIENLGWWRREQQCC